MVRMALKVVFEWFFGPSKYLKLFYILVLPVVLVWTKLDELLDDATREQF